MQSLDQFVLGWCTDWIPTPFTINRSQIYQLSLTKKLNNEGNSILSML